MSVSFPSPLAAAPAQIADAIRGASARTGIGADFLAAQARIESSFDPEARAATSSAAGLYQFIEQTWLGVMKTHGGKHGLGWAAERISDRGGHFDAGAAQREILKLRTDPGIAAAMAAELAADNREHLGRRLDRPVNDTDLYLAHFLGAAGAARFLGDMERAPHQPAASAMPAAARANGPVFFTPAGAPRSLQQVYDGFAAKLGSAAAPPERAARSEHSPAPRPASAVRDALEATRRWVENRHFEGQRSFAPTPADARLLYLSLTSGTI